MFYVFSIAQRESRRFDAYVEGRLFDERNNLAVNLFLSGKSVKEKASSGYRIEVDLEFSQIGALKDRLVTFVHNSPVFLISKKLKNILQEHCSEAVEFFPVLIDQVNDKPLADYFICNLTEKYDCIDYDQSTLLYEDPEDQSGQSGIYAIKSLVVDEAKIPPGQEIFLLSNIRKPVVLISQELMQKMVTRNVRGIEFIPPAEFSI